MNAPDDSGVRYKEFAERAKEIWAPSETRDNPGEKHKEFHSLWYGRGTLELTVRPESPERFIEMTRRFSGSYTRSVTSKTLWMAGNMILLGSLVAVSIFEILLMIYLDALGVGIAIVLFIFLCCVPQLRIFIWTMTPPKPKEPLTWQSE